MKSNSIENLIVKYLTNEATIDDLNTLSNWIEDKNNQQLFRDFVKIHFETSTILAENDVDGIKKALLAKIEEERKPVYIFDFKSILKYAAVLAFLLGLGYFYLINSESTNDENVAVEEVLTSDSEAITILLDDGTTKIIDSDAEDILTDSSGNLIGAQHKNQLSYSDASIEHLMYNTIKVPFGKRFDVVLSDGTHVYLNSGTSLKYPVKFLKNNETRDVFLNGEAYFDVAENTSQPFIVHANTMNVKVLGTGFNVSNYSSDANVQTVLVEGSVELFNDNANQSLTKSTIIRPGTKAEWDKNNEKINLENVDTTIYTAWKEGKLIFRSAKFSSIRKTLERHYNVVIKNNNKDLDAQLFSATFDIETIYDVLETFNRSYAIEFEIINNEIIIN